MSSSRDDASSGSRYGYAIEAVDNAAKTLLMLRGRPVIRAVEVAAELGVARSTAHRMVSTLTQAGMLQQLADKAYGPGPALVELGRAVLDATDLRPIVQPVLTRLAIETGETTHFLVREGAEAEFRAVAEGTFIIRAASRVGTRLPAHVTSAGKCMLASLDDDELRELYPPGRALRGGTDDAIHDRAQLVAELARVARQGWAVNQGESEQGLFGVSVPVRGHDGRVVGAITVSGPADRLASRKAATIDRMQAAVAGLGIGIRGAA